MGKYLERLNQSADETKKSAAATAEAHAKATVEQKLSGLKAQAVTLKAAYESTLGAVPFNVDKVLGLQKEISQNKADADAVEQILKSEF
jgi:hypothetical protein